MKGKATRRRGAVYIVVVGTAMIVALIGLCAMQVVRLERRVVDARLDMSEARALAQSGVEFALARADHASGGWRYTHTHDVVAQTISLGNGRSVSYKLLDETDSDLADSASDPVVVKGIGIVNDVTFVFAVDGKEGGDGLLELDWGTWRKSSL